MVRRSPKTNSRDSVRRSRLARRGATSFQILVLLVPVLFGMMGFAVDLGRLYMVRGELKAAAQSAALAAAMQLQGTDTSSDIASVSARYALENSGGFANRYDYGGRTIGDTEGDFSSTIEDPQFYETAAAATASEGGSAAGSTAKHVRVTLAAEAPTVFWRMLAVGQAGRVNVRVSAVAGLSAPLCTACGIEALVVAALNTDDDVDWGFENGTRYTFGYVCSGGGQPGPLAGTTQRIPYLLINRLDADSELEEQTQSYRIGAGGLPGSTVETKACGSINAVEAIWDSAAALTCGQNRVPAPIQSLLCGMANRFEAGVYAGCETITDIDTYSNGYVPDTDITETDDYVSTYTGNGRRVITVAIADSLADTTAMTILGFRQFLVNPVTNTTNINPFDTNGRITGTYIGSPKPLRQGRFSGCSISTGPSKVVLHQ